MPFNQQFGASLKASEIYGIVTTYADLHNNVQPSMTERYQPDCSPTSSHRGCGLNGHCGSKLCLKHEFSYTVNGAAAYGATSGVGFEDDVLLIAEEGHPMASWGASEAITGTVQVLDVATGDFYQLPHLSVGVVEMAFSISTGHPDYIAVGIEEYGISGSYNGACRALVTSHPAFAAPLRVTFYVPIPTAASLCPPLTLSRRHQRWLALERVDRQERQVHRRLLP